MKRKIIAAIVAVGIAVGVLTSDKKPESVDAEEKQEKVTNPIAQKSIVQDALIPKQEGGASIILPTPEKNKANEGGYKFLESDLPDNFRIHRGSYFETWSDNQRVFTGQQHENSDVSYVNFSLSDKNLSDSNFINATVENAIFDGTVLSGSSFFGANLANASLKETNLGGVSFDEADLRGVDLSGAILDGTSFAGADLRGANLDNANIDSNVSFANINIDATAIDSISSPEDREGLLTKIYSSNFVANSAYGNYDSKIEAINNIIPYEIGSDNYEDMKLGLSSADADTIDTHERDVLFMHLEFTENDSPDYNKLMEKLEGRGEDMNLWRLVNKKMNETQQGQSQKNDELSSNGVSSVKHDSKLQLANKMAAIRNV